MPTLAEILAYIDSRKRVAGRNLRDLVENPTDALTKTAYQAAQTIPEYVSDPMNFVGGGMAGTFIGKGAKTWNAAMHNKAAQMEAAGASPREIWAETGTWKGPDGNWRQEIPDNESAMVDLPRNQTIESFVRDAEIEKYGRRGAEPTKMTRKEFSDYKKWLSDVEAVYDKTNATSRPLESIFSHGELKRSYPDLYNETSVFFSPHLGKSGSYGRRTVSFGDATNPEGVRGLFGHELQHAVQQREGWARGGSPEEMREEALGMLRRDVASGAIPTTEQAMDMLPMAQQNAYRRLAGEAEARATQKRMNLDAAQRRAIFPEDDYDVPLSALIFR